MREPKHTPSEPPEGTDKTHCSAQVFLRSVEGNQPLMATAIHNGHDLRAEVAEIMSLDGNARLREEDPYTEMLTAIVQNQLVVYRSRFEVDLNRPREKAIYRVPEDAWGLDVWKAPPPEGLIASSLAEYDEFYSRVHRICARMEEEFGRFVVLDLHSYNHRRRGVEAPPAAPDENPEVNIGTGTMNRDKWAGLVDRFIDDLRAFDYLGRTLNVRENVKFRGGHFVKYIHEAFPDSGCALAIEFKKFFMDEWTGMVDRKQLMALREALRSTVPGLTQELNLPGSKA